MFLNGKKQIELLLLEYFRQLYPYFPKGKIIPSESPDFILNHSISRTIGIELVRLHPANLKSSREFPLYSGLEDRIPEMVRNLVGETELRKLFVKFLFSGTPVYDELRLSVVATHTARVIINGIPEKSRTFFFRKFSGRELMPEIETVLVIYHPELKTPVWESANHSAATSDIVSDINYSIQKKEEKIHLYLSHQLDLCWLLITTSHLHSSKSFNIDNKIDNHPFHSEFQRVFLLETMKARIIELV
jgi:hypothetical protein